MANITSVQIILDGPRNVVVKVQGVLDTSDVASTTLLDPATLQGIDWAGTLKALHLKVTKITYNVIDGLTLNFFWDATTPVLIEELAGRGCMHYEEFGGLVSNAGAGDTGKIKFSTTGWSGVKTFAAVVECIKTQT